MHGRLLITFGVITYGVLSAGQYQSIGARCVPYSVALINDLRPSLQVELFHWSRKIV